MIISTPLSIGLAASLLGLAQNSLLVALPVLAAASALTIPQWGSLILTGSLLFAVGNPLWGRLTDRWGPRPILVVALLGYTLSFALIGLAFGAKSRGLLSPALLYTAVAGARLLYGLTASGLVPACQRWALARRPDDRVRALTSVSAGLTTGRLIGPPMAGMAVMAGAEAAIACLVVAGMSAITLIAPLTGPPGKQPSDQPAEWRLSQAKTLWPCLGMASFMALAVSIMQLALPERISFSLQTRPDQTALWMSLLLFVGAVAALTIQTGVLRYRTPPERRLLALGSCSLAGGIVLLIQTPGIVGLILGVMAVTGGSALLVPAYTARATRHGGDGARAGLIGMAHTGGYASALLTVTLAPEERLLHVGLIAAIGLLAVVALVRLGEMRTGHHLPTPKQQGTNHGSD